MKKNSWIYAIIEVFDANSFSQRFQEKIIEPPFSKPF